MKPKRGLSKVTRRVSKRRRADEILEQQAATLRKQAQLLELAHDMIIVRDMSGKITFWNRGAEEKYGWTKAEALGKQAHHLLQTQFAKPLEEIEDELFREGRWEGELAHTKQDGSSLVVASRWALQRDNEGTPLTILEINNDITERKRAEEERTQLLAREKTARAEAEAANRIKDEFLSTLSHELLTPLTLILGWIRLLRTGNLDEPTAANALESIELSAKSHAHRLEDLLEVSRIITGRFRLDIYQVEIVPIIEAAINAICPAAEAKGIQLERLYEAFSVPISADPNRLQQVVWNLLSNAIKFTPKGGHVQIRLERVDSEVKLTISDTGQGIRPEFLPYVFDRFRQADSSSIRQHGGLGLGLAIVRHLVELHGGTVQAASREDVQGTTFSVALPLATPSHPAASQHVPERRQRPAGNVVAFGRVRALQGLRVLVVDDEAECCTLLTMILDQYGASVIAAASAAEALEALERLRPDILVSDIEMPGEDGYTLIRRVRQMEAERGGQIPAVALTAYARTEDRVRSLAAGFQMHVRKPIEPAELVAVVSSLTGRTGKI